MAKITGKESAKQLPEKVLKLYQAVVELVGEGADIGALKVSSITKRAGIGKGTAYDYFDTREEIIVYAIAFFMEEAAKKLESEIWEKENFTERIVLCMDFVDRQMQRGACLLCLVNLFFEVSDMGTLFRGLLEMRKREGACQPVLLVKKIIEQGIRDGKIHSKLPIDYMAYTLLTKLLAYMAYLFHEQSAKENAFPESRYDGAKLSCEEFRRCILEGILEEFQAE